MPAPMRKPLIEVWVKLGNKVLHYTNVPSSKLKPVLILLKDYQEQPVPWRELAGKRIQAAGGEAGYMLRVSREKAELTQSQLATKLHMPQGNISQIESGKRPIGKALAKRFAKVLKVDYRVFL